MPRLQLLLGLLALLCGALHVADSHPQYWLEDASSCTSHPSSGRKYGHHPTVTSDTSATLTVIDSSNATVTSVCPGNTYKVKVAFGSAREALVTASPASSGSGSCSNRWYTTNGGAQAQLLFSWQLPCTLTGSPQVTITSGTGERAALAQTQLTLPVQDACSAAPSCASGSGSGTSVLKLLDTSASSATESATSDLGYQFAQVLPGGAKIHYSKGGTLPVNDCTKGATNTLTGVDPAQMLHYAVKSPLQGYIAMGFTSNPGKMYPSDAVIGSVDSSGVASMQTYHISGYSVGPGDTNSGWATNQGVVKVNGSVVMCFSRPATVSSSSGRRLLATTLDTSSVPMIWAASGSTAFQQHSTQGSVTLNMDQGTATGASGESGGDALVNLHGVLMVLAFVVLMPGAVILARHKWMYGDAKENKIKPGWFLLHMRIQIAAIVLAVASFVLIYVVAGTDDGGHKLFTPHRALGIVAVVLAMLQMGIGMGRPLIKSPKRPAWRGLHYAVGYSSMFGGNVNCFLGLFMIHDLAGQHLAYWLAPVVILTAIWLVLAVVLEVKKAKLQAARKYNATTHDFSGAAPPAEVGLSAPRAPADIATVQVLPPGHPSSAFGGVASPRK